MGDPSDASEHRFSFPTLFTNRQRNKKSRSATTEQSSALPKDALKLIMDVLATHKVKGTLLKESDLPARVTVTLARRGITRRHGLLGSLSSRAQRQQAAALCPLYERIGRLPRAERRSRLHLHPHFNFRNLGKSQLVRVEHEGVAGDCDATAEGSKPQVFKVEPALGRLLGLCRRSIQVTGYSGEF